MTWSLPIEPEIVRCPNQALSKVMLPNSICHNASGKRVRGIRHPLCKLQSTLSCLGIVCFWNKRSIQLLYTTKRPCGNFVQRLMDIPFFESTKRRRVDVDIGPPEDVKAKLFLGGAAIEGSIAMSDWSGPKSGADPIVVVLIDRVELVIVTACTLDRQSQKRSGSGMNKVFQSLVLIFSHIVWFVIPCPKSQEACGDDVGFISIRQLVSS